MPLLDLDKLEHEHDMYAYEYEEACLTLISSSSSICVRSWNLGMWWHKLSYGDLWNHKCFLTWKSFMILNYENNMENISFGPF